MTTDPIPAPWWSQLPVPLPALVAAFPPVPPAITLLSALTVIGAAAGRSALLQLGPGQIYTGELQTLIATPDEPAAQQVINALGAPLRAIQAELLAAQAQRSAAAVQAELAQVERQREEHMARLRFAPPEHAAFYAAKLGKLRSALRPLVVVEGAGHRLRPALERSFDQSILRLCDQPSAGDELLGTWASYRGRQDLEIIQAAQHQQPYVGELVAGVADAALAAPGVSVLLHCAQAALDDLLVWPEAALITREQGFWVLSRWPPTTAAAPVGAAFPTDWAGLIRRLFTARQAGQPTIYRLDASARDYIGRTEQLGEKDPGAATVERKRWLLQRAYPLCLLLHLCDPAPAPMIPSQTAGQAIALAQEAGGHQPLVLQDLRAGSPLDWFVQDELVAGPGRRLTVTGCLKAYREYCQRLGLPAPRQRGFKVLIGPAIEAAYGVRLRCDLADAEGKAQRGWKQVGLRNAKVVGMVVV